jgi:hypothetical protein
MRSPKTYAYSIEYNLNLNYGLRLTYLFYKFILITRVFYWFFSGAKWQWTGSFTNASDGDKTIVTTDKKLTLYTQV